MPRAHRNSSEVQDCGSPILVEECSTGRSMWLVEQHSLWDDLCKGLGVGSGAPGEDLSLAYLGFGINEAHSMLIDGN